MRRAALPCLIASLLLAGCQPTPAPAPAAAPTTTPPAATASDAPAAPPATSAAPTQGEGPSFDCSKARGAQEQLVCGDPELAALDRQLAETYRQAQAKASDPALLRATQRGWVKGRDECWKAADIRSCVSEAYVRGIVDLRIQHGLVQVPATVEYRCDDATAHVAAVFYNDPPQAMVLTVGDDQAILPIARSGSGARYAASGVEFWEHQGEASIDFFGKTLRCTPAR